MVQSLLLFYYFRIILHHFPKKYFRKIILKSE